MGTTQSCSSVRDRFGVEWVTVTEATRQVYRSRRTIERWIVAGLPTQTIRGIRYVPIPALFDRLRAILTAEPESKTRRER